MTCGVWRVTCSVCFRCCCCRFPHSYADDVNDAAADADAKQAKTILREGCLPPPGLIIGCTNPFFLKLANAWPHLCPALHLPLPPSTSLHSLASAQICKTLISTNSHSFAGFVWATALARSARRCLLRRCFFLQIALTDAFLGAQVTERVSQSKMLGAGGGGGLSTPLFASKAKSVSPNSHPLPAACFYHSQPTFRSFLYALQVIKMPKEVLSSALNSRCSAAVLADAAAATPPPSSPSKLKAPAGAGLGGAAAAVDALPPRPPHMPPCNGGTLLRLHLAQLTSAFLQASASPHHTHPPLASTCGSCNAMLQLLQPFQPYLNTVASPGLPLPVLQCFRPSVFLQALGTNLHITQLLFLMYFFAQALCPDSLHPLFKVRTHPIPHVTCHPTLHP